LFVPEKDAWDGRYSWLPRQDDVRTISEEDIEIPIYDISMSKGVRVL